MDPHANSHRLISDFSTNRGCCKSITYPFTHYDIKSISGTNLRIECLGNQQYHAQYYLKIERKPFELPKSAISRLILTMFIESSVCFMQPKEEETI